MARRSANEMAEINTRVPRGHQGYWKLILKLDAQGPWGVPDILEGSNGDRASIKDFVLRLVRAGIAEPEGTRLARTGKCQVRLYRLNKRPVDAPRLDRQGNVLCEPTIETLWRTMKMAKTFTVLELAELATTPDNAVAEATARRYVSHLKRAGIVACSGPNTRTPRYRLVRDIGAKAPIILKTLSLYDPNAHEILGEGESVEVKP